MNRQRAALATWGVGVFLASLWVTTMVSPWGSDERSEIEVTSLRVIDGDTFETQEGKTIRLWGIDAPEIDAPGGRAAKVALNSIANKAGVVTCFPHDTDPYGRTVARCEDAIGLDIACLMVSLGHAWDWPKYSRGYYSDCAS